MPQQELSESQEIWKTISAGKVLDGRIAVVAEATKNHIDVEKAKRAARLTECLGNIREGIAEVKELQCRSCRMHGHCGIEDTALEDIRPIGAYTSEIIDAVKTGALNSNTINEMSRQWGVAAAQIDRTNPFGENYIGEVDKLLALSKSHELHQGNVDSIDEKLLGEMLDANNNIDWLTRFMISDLCGIEDQKALLSKMRTYVNEKGSNLKKGKVPSITYEQRYRMFERGRQLIENGMSVNRALLDIESDLDLNPMKYEKMTLFRYLSNELNQVRPEGKGKGNRFKNKVQHEQSNNTLDITDTKSLDNEASIIVDTQKPAVAEQAHTNGNGIQKTIVMNPDVPQFYNPMTRLTRTESNGHKRVEHSLPKREVVSATHEGFGVERTDEALRFNLRGVGIDFAMDSFESSRNNGSAEKLVMLEDLIKKGSLEIRNPRVRTRTLIELIKFLNAVLFTDTEYITFDGEKLALAGGNREP